MQRIDLKFDTQEQAVEALAANGFPAEMRDGLPHLGYPQGAFCGNYGRIWRTVGEGEAAQPEMLPGIHVTVLAEECPEALLPFRVQVDTPFMVI